MDPIYFYQKNSNEMHFFKNIFPYHTTYNIPISPPIMVLILAEIALKYSY